MHLTVDEFLRRINDDPPARFHGSVHVTDDCGEYVNNIDVVAYATGDPRRPLIWFWED
jgi:hypothetical protein